MVSVLVVDDENVLLDMIAGVIEEAGYDPMMATNGKEALAVLATSSQRPSLVISDVMMPYINGIELANLLRSDPRYGHVPIILMSAAQPPVDNGIVDHFLPKPFDLDRLMSLVDRYVHASIQ